jgi:hypothetical protein
MLEVLAMTKWADYLISAVRYNDPKTHIVAVRCHPDNGDSVGAGTEVQRTTVVAKIDAGSTFATIRKTQEGKWIRGEDVRTVIVDHTAYIRTDANGVKADNLGDLPLF